MYKNILMSTHARQRMETRKISEREILNALNFPDKKLLNNGMNVSMKKRGNKHLLIIIHREIGKYQKIITVIDTSKITKYL